MSHVQIRDVPEPVLDILKQSAVERGQSLQRYLLDLLTDQARLATTTAILDEAAANAREAAATQPFDSVTLVREGRAERDAHVVSPVPHPRR